MKIRSPNELFSEKYFCNFKSKIFRDGNQYASENILLFILKFSENIFKYRFIAKMQEKCKYLDLILPQ